MTYFSPSVYMFINASVLLTDVHETKYSIQFTHLSDILTDAYKLNIAYNSHIYLIYYSIQFTHLSDILTDAYKTKNSIQIIHLSDILTDAYKLNIAYKSHIYLIYLLTHIKLNIASNSSI